MNFFTKHKDKVNAKKHFEFLLNLCILTIENEHDAKLYLGEYQRYGNWKNTFNNNFDDRLTFWIKQIALHHNAADSEVYSMPNEKIPLGPDYSDSKQIFKLILEAFFIILILDDTYDITKQLQNLSSYAKRNGIQTAALNNILQAFQEIIKTRDCYRTDIRKIDFYPIVDILYRRIPI